MRAKFFSSSASKSVDNLVGFNADAEMGSADEATVLDVLSRRHAKYESKRVSFLCTCDCVMIVSTALWAFDGVRS